MLNGGVVLKKCIVVILFVCMCWPGLVFASVPTSGNTLTVDVPYYDYNSGSGVMSNTYAVGDLTTEQVYSVSRVAVGNMVIQLDTYMTTTYTIFMDNIQGDLTYSLPLKLYTPYGLSGYDISLIAVSASGDVVVDMRTNVSLDSNGCYLFSGTYALPDGDYTSYKLIIKTPLDATAGTTPAGDTKTVVSTIQMDASFGAYTFEVAEDDEIIGLLDGIIGWIQNIYNGIVDLPSNIATTVSNVFTGIFDSWFSTDSDLATDVDTGNTAVGDVQSLEDDLLTNSMDHLDNVSFDFGTGVSAQTISAMLWLVPYGDKLIVSVGIIKDVFVVLLTCGLITLLLGRGLRVLGRR